MHEHKSTHKKFYPYPPGGKISYEVLLREIYRRVVSREEAQKLVKHIRCHGVPGNWMVGIYIEGEGVVYPSTVRHCKNYDEGFYQLLRWLHDRNFQPFDS